MDTEKLWDQYAQNNIGWIEEWVDIDSHDFQDKVPSSWIQLVKNPCSTTVQNIWKIVDNTIPRFLDYLSYAIVEARIALTKVGRLCIGLSSKGVARELYRYPITWVYGSWFTCQGKRPKTF